MVPGEKKSTYRGFTEAQARAHKKYLSEHKIVEIKVRMTEERRDTVKAHAEAQGESLNQFVNRAIDQALELDGEK